MDEIEKYKRFCICCCKLLKDKYYRLMKTGRLTVVGEAFVTVTQLSWASLKNKACVALVSRSQTLSSIAQHRRGKGLVTLLCSTGSSHAHYKVLM